MKGSAAKEPMVEAKEISFAYRKNDPVLTGVTFTVNRGDFFGIIGPNGSGKSTLLRILLGLIKPHRGSVRVLGEDPTRSRKRAAIGYLSQTSTFFDRSFPGTVIEVVLMGRVARAGLFRRLGSADTEHCMEALRTVGMEEHAQRKIGELSSGQQQRVMIARALAGEPELVILDEPTVGVDVNAEAEFYKLMRKLNVEKKLTLIIVTHDMDIVGHQVNKLMCLHCSIATHGTPKQFLEGDALHAAAGQGIQLIPHHDQHHHEHRLNDTAL